MYIEITKEAFNKLVPNNLPCASVKHGEIARQTYYYNAGMKFKVVENFVSFVTQYYIEDINA